MLIYSASARRVVAINGNMMAPARATIAHYRALGLELIPGAGLLAAGVPAAFDALVTALRDFGTRSLADVLEPALQLAEDGFPMHVGLSGDPDIPDEAVAGAGASLRINAKRFLTKWPSSGRVYLPDGKVPLPGSVLKNPALANFFKRVLDSESSAKNRGRESWPRRGARSLLSRRHRARHRRVVRRQRRLARRRRPRALHDAHRVAGERRLSRRHGVQVRAVVARPGIFAAAQVARRLRPRRDGP